MHALITRCAFAELLRRWLVVFVLIIMGFAAYAQAQLPKWVPDKPVEPDLKELADWTKPTSTERPPFVPPPSSYHSIVSVPVYKDGGHKGMMLSIQRNIQQSNAGNSRCTEGRVFVTFDVGSDGKVYDATIVKSLHPSCDAEALKAVKLLGEFKPGIGANGKPITVSFTLPVYFHK